MKTKLIIIMITIFPLLSIAQDNTAPCSSAESSQFDFWVGEWDLSWEDANGKTQTGKNVITRILGSCAIQENFSTSDGSFSGKSFSVYNQKKGIWEQTWVDNSGAYLTFSGGIQDSKMTLSREVITNDGKKLGNRMVFYDISNDSFTWDWESTNDGGVTWTLLWRINYKRAQ